MTSGVASPTADMFSAEAKQVHTSPALTPLTNGTMPSNSSRKITICVFCGASPGTSPSHMAAARSLAQAFHKHNISLVTGGGSVGLMGEVARTLVALSGPEAVHGIIPAPLMKYERGPDGREKEARSGLGENGEDEKLPDYKVYGKTTVVKDMHTRKHMMAQEVLAGAPGSGFVALSGGYGTLEELMEVVTWNQLGIHDRGVVVYNVEGYWDGLLDWIGGSVKAGFVREGSAGIIKEARTSEEVVSALRNYQVAEGRFKLEWGNE